MKRTFFFAASFALAVAGAFATKASTKAPALANVFFRPTAVTCVLQPECGTIETDIQCTATTYYTNSNCNVQVPAYFDGI